MVNKGRVSYRERRSDTLCKQRGGESSNYVKFVRKEGPGIIFLGWKLGSGTYSLFSSLYRRDLIKIFYWLLSIGVLVERRKC